MKKKKHLHLLVTSMCLRNCKHCCNKQYNLNKIPYVTSNDIKKIDTLLITGGEPFLFSNPNIISHYFKNKYKNIKNIYVYSNSSELAIYLYKSIDALNNIDGLSVSIKNKKDLKYFEQYIINDERVLKMKSNRVYIFNNLFPYNYGNFSLIQRKRQKNFKPAKNCIFRKV